MTIGFVSLAGRGATDACLADAVERLSRSGLRLAGTVQTLTQRDDRHPCDMDLQVLPDGPMLRISQDRGQHARSCRLDGGVLEEAVVAVSQRLAGASLLVVNKFGKLESEGRGFVPLIAEAVSAAIPVLVGVNGLNRDAFLAFAEDMAVALPADPQAIADWALAQVSADA